MTASSSSKELFKIILLGDKFVGKTSIRKRFINETFSISYNPTIGADFDVKPFGNYELQIWDLAGHNTFQSIRDLYYKGTKGIILVYDITNLDSFRKLETWIEEIRLQELYSPILLVGNKSDLESKRIVLPTVALQLRQQISSELQVPCHYIETSAVMGSRINDVFTTLVKEISKSQL